MDAITAGIRAALKDLSIPMVRVEGGRSEESGEKIATRIVASDISLRFPPDAVDLSIPQCVTLGILNDDKILTKITQNEESVVDFVMHGFRIP